MSQQIPFSFDFIFCKTKQIPAVKDRITQTALSLPPPPPRNFHASFYPIQGHILILTEIHWKVLLCVCLLRNFGEYFNLKKIDLNN